MPAPGSAVVRTVPTAVSISRCRRPRQASTQRRTWARATPTTARTSSLRLTPRRCASSPDASPADAQGERGWW
jgi:hypothetical protein